MDQARRRAAREANLLTALTHTQWTTAMLKGFGRRPFAGARGLTRGRRPKAS